MLLSMGTFMMAMIGIAALSLNPLSGGVLLWLIAGLAFMTVSYHIVQRVLAYFRPSSHMEKPQPIYTESAATWEEIGFVQALYADSDAQLLLKPSLPSSSTSLSKLSDEYRSLQVDESSMAFWKPRRYYRQTVIKFAVADGFGKDCQEEARNYLIKQLQNKETQLERVLSEHQKSGVSQKMNQVEFKKDLNFNKQQQKLHVVKYLLNDLQGTDVLSKASPRYTLADREQHGLMSKEITTTKTGLLKTARQAYPKVFDNGFGGSDAAYLFDAVGCFYALYDQSEQQVSQQTGYTKLSTT